MVKALVTTLPKSGTHLINVVLHGLGLSRHHVPLGEASVGLLQADPDVAKASVQHFTSVVDAMPDNSFVLHHIPYTKQLMYELARREVRAIVLIRNPFDFVVSLAHHLRNHPEGDTPPDLSLHQLQHWICTGGEGSSEAPQAKRYFRIMHGWVNDPRALAVRFEDLVGPRGGGLFSDQLGIGLRIQEFLGIQKDIGDLSRILVGSYRPGIALFRRGQIGSGREEMLENTAEQIRLLYPASIGGWGYEPDGALTQHAGERPEILSELNAATAALIWEHVHLREKIRRLSETDQAEQVNLPESDDN